MLKWNWLKHFNLSYSRPSHRNWPLWLALWYIWTRNFLHQVLDLLERYCNRTTLHWWSALQRKNSFVRLAWKCWRMPKTSYVSFYNSKNREVTLRAKYTLLSEFVPILNCFKSGITNLSFYCHRIICILWIFFPRFIHLFHQCLPIKKSQGKFLFLFLRFA